MARFPGGGLEKPNPARTIDALADGSQGDPQLNVEGKNTTNKNTSNFRSTKHPATVRPTYSKYVQHRTHAKTINPTAYKTSSIPGTETPEKQTTKDMQKSTAATGGARAPPFVASKRAPHVRVTFLISSKLSNNF